MLIKKQGFAALPQAKHKRISSKGGKAKVPKGRAMLSPEDRIVTARNAANVRWEKYRMEQQAKNATINSAEDGRLKETDVSEAP